MSVATMAQGPAPPGGGSKTVNGTRSAPAHSILRRREGDGAAETHETQVDVVTVVSGEGTLEVAHLAPGFGGAPVPRAAAASGDELRIPVGYQRKI